MSHNTFGHLFRVTTWGESHGPALGCVVDGCPPGLPLTAADIQFWLNRRAPGTSRFVTQRREPDEVKILSGVFEDDRTGGSGDDGHADLADDREHRSARQRLRRHPRQSIAPATRTTSTTPNTACATIAAAGGRPRARRRARVAAGAVARRCAGRRRSSNPRGGRADRQDRDRSRERWDWAETENNPFWCPDCGHSETLGRIARRDAQRRQLRRRDRRELKRRACPQAGARRFTASSMPNWPAR